MVVFIFKRLGIPDVILVEPQLFSDNRGFFYEGFKEKEFNENGISVKFTQDNFSYSVKNVILGHGKYQRPVVALLPNSFDVCNFLYPAID